MTAKNTYKKLILILCLSMRVKLIETLNSGITFLRTKTKVGLRDSTFVLSHVGETNNTSLAWGCFHIIKSKFVYSDSLMKKCLHDGLTGNY